MLGTKTRALTIAAGLLLPTAFAIEVGTRSFYIFKDGDTMTEGAPTNVDPTGFVTLEADRLGETHDAATAALAAPLAMPIADALRVHLHAREAVSPFPAEYLTSIRIFVKQPNGTVPIGADGGRWHLAFGVASYLHPADPGRSSGWTDFVLDANATMPTRNACNPNGCITVADGVLTLPAGVRIQLETGLVATTSCAFDVCSAFGGTLATAADMLVEATDDVDAAAPIDLYDPLGPLVGDCDGRSCFDPIHNDLERFLRQQNGGFLQGTSHLDILPRATWRSASTTSDSRLEIRLA